MYSHSHKCSLRYLRYRRRHRHRHHSQPGLRLILLVSIIANLVLQDTVERIFVQNLYADVIRGIYLVRGENVLLLGEIVRATTSTFRASNCGTLPTYDYRTLIKTTIYLSPTNLRLWRKSLHCRRKKRSRRRKKRRHLERSFRSMDLRESLVLKQYFEGNMLRRKHNDTRCALNATCLVGMSQQNIVKCCSSKADGHAYITVFRRKTSNGLAEGRYDHTIICGGIYSSIILDHSGQYKLCVIID